MNYLLRDIDPAVWQRVKTRANDENLSVRLVLSLLAQAYADGKILISAAPRKDI